MLPAGTQAGDLIILHLTGHTSAPTSAYPGWNLIGYHKIDRLGNSMDVTATPQYRFYTGEALGSLVVGGFYERGGFLTAWRGVDEVSPLDVPPVLYSTPAAVTSHASPAITPVTPHSMLVAMTFGERDYAFTNESRPSVAKKCYTAVGYAASIMGLYEPVPTPGEIPGWTWNTSSASRPITYSIALRPG
jgi:hypothetical protein